MKFRTNMRVALDTVILFLTGVTAILFAVLYVETFSVGFFHRYKKIVVAAVTASVCLIYVLAIIFSFGKNEFIYKLTVLVLALAAIGAIILYFLKISGVLDKIDSVEDLRNYVASFGYLAVVIYIVMNVLQVVILPIPGFIAVGTGVALFGPLKTALFSLAGIVIGSCAAFFIGRALGYKVVCWLVGKDTLDKWLKAVKNKDKIVLTFMFLFPFFPDDVLCFVAGLSSMSAPYFTVMIILCRAISCFVTAYSLNGNVIPYTTWWGILIWAFIFIMTAAVTVLLYKHGEKIEKNIKGLFKKNHAHDTSRRSE